MLYFGLVFVDDMKFRLRLGNIGRPRRVFIEEESVSETLNNHSGSCDKGLGELVLSWGLCSFLLLPTAQQCLGKIPGLDQV